MVTWNPRRGGKGKKRRVYGGNEGGKAIKASEGRRRVRVMKYHFPADSGSGCLIMKTRQVGTLPPPTPLPLITSLFSFHLLSTKLPLQKQRAQTLSVAPVASPRIAGVSCRSAIASFWGSD